MKRVIIIIATLALATSAMAMIGQTPDQVMADAQREKAVRVETVQFRGRTMLQVTYQDSFIHHLFDTNGREIALYYYAGSRFTATDIDKLQRRYHTAWRGPETRNGVSIWKSANGLQMMAQRQESHDYLSIFDMSRIQEIANSSSNGTVLPDTAETNVYPPPQQSYVAPPVAPSPPAATLPSQNDCLIVATEAYSRLKPTSYWVRMAATDITIKDTKRVGSHAIVFFQPTATSNVFLYDANGSVDLHTQSHDLREITAAAHAISQASLIPYSIQAVEWIGDEPDYLSTNPNAGLIQPKSIKLINQ